MRIADLTVTAEYALADTDVGAWLKRARDGDVHAAEALIDHVRRVALQRTWTSGKVMVGFGDGTEALRWSRELPAAWDELIALVARCADAAPSGDGAEEDVRARLRVRLRWQEPLSARGLALIWPHREWVLACGSAEMAAEVADQLNAGARVSTLQRLVLGVTLDDLPVICAQHLPMLPDRR